MLGMAGALGCNGNDIACMCGNQNFGFGVHDCSVEVCSDAGQANQAISWANNLCSNAGVPANIATVTAVCILHSVTSSRAIC